MPQRLVLVQVKLTCAHCGSVSWSTEGVKIFDYDDLGVCGRFTKEATEAEIRSDLPRATFVATRAVNRCGGCWHEQRLFEIPRNPQPQRKKTSALDIDIDDLGV